MTVRDHGDALDFDLFDRWRVRLKDVPLSIGWGAVALFLRHLPRDCETRREIDPSAAWSDETHMLAALHDLIGDLWAEDYKHIDRPSSVKPYATAAAVDTGDYNKLLSIFGGGHDG